VVSPLYCPRGVVMFCPQCRAEYRVGFIRCSDCDVALVEHLRVDAPAPVTDVPRGSEENGFEAEPELVVIRTYQGGPDADLAKSVLEAAGIESILRDEGISRHYLGLSLPQGTQLLVLAEDAEDAEKILSMNATEGNDASRW
jgi:Putative prokaryotic signal transducing protein